jgi:ABC-2 type transport system permease protein
VTRLLRSEFLRFRSRRLVWGLMILALVGAVVGAAIVAVNSRPPSSAQLTTARAEYRRELAACVEGEFGVPKEALGDLTLQEWCDQNVRPEQFVGGELFAVANLPDVLRGTAFILLVMGLMIGSSSMGAEWQSGSVATLLTWEPRRLRVLLVRSVVVAAMVFILAVAMQAVLGALLWSVAVWRGTTLGAGAPLLQNVAGVTLRVATVAALTSLFGVAIATIGRNTAAALGAVFVYLAVIESLLRALEPRFTPWLLGPNAVVFVDGRPGVPSATTTTVITVGHALVVIGGYALVLLVVAVASFRARDIA